MIVYIPQETERIRPYQFKYRLDITKVVLPNSLRHIGTNAFEGCINLKAIIIPSSVTSIGEAAFKNCRRLKRVTLPEELTSIRKSTFEGCTALEALQNTQQIFQIDNAAFKDCKSLKTIDLSGLHALENQAFKNTGLCRLTLPDTVESLPPDTFTNCTDLKVIDIPAHLNMKKIPVQGFLNLIHKVFPMNPRIVRRAAILSSNGHPKDFILWMKESRGTLNRKISLFLSLCLARSSKNSLPSEIKELILTFTAVYHAIIPPREGRMQDIDGHILSESVSTPARSIDPHWAKSWDSLDLDTETPSESQKDTLSSGKQPRISIKS